jgi:23S rRNA pseudouridine2457 synthase
VQNYFVAYKPFQVLSQFSPQESKKTLKDFFRVASDVYPVGRLDFDSEGMLLLSNDPSLNKRLLHPTFAHDREYFVQVEGLPTNEAIARLSRGVSISVDGKPYKTKPCLARILNPDPVLPERNPPIRFRKNIPTQWISITLTEGRNRQVRKMTAAIGFPTLRLIRYRIEGLSIDRMQPGELIQLDKAEIFGKLGILGN